MSSLSRFLFGSLTPALEVLLVLAWVLALPLSGTCITTAIALFFIAPPAHAYA